MQGVRVLVVDDFAEWRRELCATIQEISGLQVVGEAADGFEAIQKSKDLRPDLILLDIGLPRLNGIEVARRLSKVCPESRIIFVTENRSSDIREEGFRAGGSAFVIKSDSPNELVAAINFVLKRKNS
ncbi:MAG TPA: response regulator transcription factor [Terriglobales bacterium]|jgi:DNA-binding NarL/FixJ family response regulator|nr:response regulator transcription factor [Terriglobales bacterium]